MPFGLTDAGFNPMRLADIQALLEEDFRAALGRNIQTHDRSVIGQLIGVVAERFAEVWAEAEKVYASAYPDGASGVALDDLASLSGITRAPATSSTVMLTLAGTPDGTIIPAGSVTRETATGERWVHLTDATIASGTATVEAESERTGPVVLRAATTLEIATVVAGWTGVTVAEDAEPGRNVESDASLRERRLLTMRSGGGSAVEAIRAAIMRLDDVTECLVIENETADEDADGRPPKSFETVVRGGVDQEIVDTIWVGKPAGIETYGTETGIATDSNGDAQTVNWTRPDEREIYIIVDYTPMNGFPADGEALIRDAILDFATTFTIGKDVIPFEIIQHIEVPNIRTLTLRVGFSSNPATSDPLTISRTELATFDSTRIEFES